MRNSSYAEHQSETRPGAAAGLDVSTGSISRAVLDFASIGLDEMAGVALLDRTDTKYLLSDAQAVAVLQRLVPHYRVLEIDGVRLNRYRTLYFDTPDLALYRRHHSGNEVRHKVRSRQYVHSGLSYFEVKRKTNKDRTVKDRLRTETLTTAVEGPARRFLTSQLPNGGPLRPALLNEFARTTLVNRGTRERVTIDAGIRFAVNGREAALPGLVIFEVKQDGFDRASPVMREMRAARIPPRGISKYCLGVSLLYEDVKHNAFKPKLLFIDKLIGGPSHG